MKFKIVDSKIVGGNKTGRLVMTVRITRESNLRIMLAKLLLRAAAWLVDIEYREEAV